MSGSADPVPLGSLVGLALVLLGVGQALAAYGLYELDRWGWTWFVLLGAASILVTSLSMLLVLGAVSFSALFDVVVTAGLLAYLYNLRELYADSVTC